MVYPTVLRSDTTPPETPALMLVITGVAILVMCVLALAGAPPAHAQRTRTTCYHSGSTEICETFDSMGNPISKSRCYKSSYDTRCDTQSFSGTPTTPFIPNGDRPQR